LRTVVFAYHEMGIVGLEALRRNNFEIVAVFSHEDDPDENRWFPSVGDWAKKQGIPLYLPPQVNTPLWYERILSLKPEVIFSFYYRKLLKREILQLPPLGAFNLHGSYLPYYRGRCPVNWVIINGERETGVTLHRMVEEPDAGDIVGQRRVPIDFYDTAFSLYKKLCCEAASLLDEFLPLIKEGRIVTRPQDLEKGSYYGGRRPEDGRIDWQKSALSIYNLIRAVTHPYPGAFTFLGGEKVMVWWAYPEEEDIPAEAGTVLVEKGMAYVATGSGRIRLAEIEIAGKRLIGEEIGQFFKEKGSLS